MKQFEVTETKEKKKVTPTEAVNEIDKSEEREQEKELPDDWKAVLKAYDECTFENAKEIALICNTANNIMYDRFRINLKRPEEPFYHEYKMTAMIFVETYRAIIDQLLERRKTNATYTINIANRLAVGFTNSDNEEDEKNGNFMIFVRDIPHYSVKDDDEIKLDSHSREYIRNWNQENMIQNPEDTMAIANRALKYLKAIEIHLGSPELVFPIFVTIYETILDCMKTLRREKEKSSIKINFCSCMWIRCDEQDDGIDKIAIIPAIENKMDLKSDKEGTAIYE